VQIAGLLLCCLTLFAQAKPKREIAITFDDLPIAQSGPAACEEPGLSQTTEKLLQPFSSANIPLAAFVIGGNCAKLGDTDRTAILKLWEMAGAELGNHTYSHFGLAANNSTEYELDILRGDVELKRLLGNKRLRYFRSPMLWTGQTLEVKHRLERFLDTHGYQQSPVTIDNSDWIFAYVYSRALDRGDIEIANQARAEYIPYMNSVMDFFEKRSVEVVGREFPQILLLHANRLNADAVPELLDMLKKRGYQFVSLEKALRDPAYRLPNNYAGPGGFSWIHRWSITKGMPKKGEPEPADWVVRELERYQ
jgi:peptidoglycan-N-acetylglucosamine deacetylase